MKDLESYLASDFHTDKQELSHLEYFIGETSRTLHALYIDQHGWPYRQTSGEIQFAQKLSQSTTSMVALALHSLLRGDAAASNCHAAHPSQYWDRIQDDLATALEEQSRSATRSILTKVIADGATNSGTYAKNDPFTVSFVFKLASIYARYRDTADPEYVLPQSLHETIDRWSSLDPADAGAHFFELEGVPESHSEELSHPLAPLRVLQSAHNAKQPISSFKHYAKYFSNMLHQHLSYSLIPDSRFDPAQLVFCLEGLLLCHPRSVDRLLFQRVIDVLSTAQIENAFWRPNKPFLATYNGMSLFPVSVEIANSLLRCVRLMDQADSYDTFGSRCLPLLRRYWQWVRARVITLNLKLPEQETSDLYIGWHSEHVNDPAFIHVWETSQILEFLISYHQLLDIHIAHTALSLSKLSVQILPALSSSEWKALVDAEPVRSLGDGYSIYSRIDKEIVSDWKQRAPTGFSALLYGPPGTGKTTVARHIAQALDFKFINVTVSDFLADGGAQIEARAKAIFDVLLSQSDCVILFDEIDNFLLDRESERYKKLESVFQFLTPGMLTKFADLRRGERCLFFIGTNYSSRIDAAIKRTGRIDRQYLVLPPDAESRLRLTKSLIQKYATKTGPHQEHASALRAALDSDQRFATSLKTSSTLLGYKDLEACVLSSLVQRANIEGLIDRMTTMTRTTRLLSYQNNKSELWPAEEFFCLAAIAIESAEPSIEIKSDAKAVIASLGLSSFDALHAKAPTGMLTAEKITSVTRALWELR